MNHNDIKLVLIIILVSLIFLVLVISNEKTGTKKAVIYYESKELLSIDLTDKKKRTYEVDGFNGKVKLLTNGGAIKVVEENSPRHICSNMGYIDKSYESIVCLPNKIVIKIVTNEDIDTVVK